MTTPHYDLVVFGATSFVGQILTRYLAEHEAEQNDAFRWAIAGRSERKLNELRQSLGKTGERLPMLVADASSEAQLQALCAQTRVVVSTVGPYALYGEPLIKICVENGTDYCDLTGETQWIRKMIGTYEATARQSGARIVHCCGFDSVPSDMGVYFLQQQAVQRWGAPASRVKMRVKTLQGGASGGTVASVINVVKEVVKDPALRKEMLNPYALCPAEQQNRAPQHFVKSAEFDRDLNAWIAPFVMAAVNERVVHRSNALSGNAYGESFTYDEAIVMGGGIRGRLKALGMVTGLGAFMLGAATSPLRRLMERFLPPKPGDGPTPEAQQAGRFELRFVGRRGAESLQVKVTGDRDPGYGSTGKMLGQAALSMALDHTENGAKAGRPGGFWTPATFFDDRYIDRLTQYAGLRFDIV